VRGAARVLVAWALLNALILVPMPTIFNENPSPAIIYAAACLGCFLVGVACWLWPRSREEDPDAVRLVTDVSYASALCGVAVALMLLSIQFGVWVLEVGGGLLALGIAGVVRELRAERRMVAR
jgi:peptidoglycan/LPS O-acetylase OafA/YrhL